MTPYPDSFLCCACRCDRSFVKRCHPTFPLSAAATWLVPAANWSTAASVSLLVLSAAAAASAALSPHALASVASLLGVLVLVLGALLAFFAASAAGGLSNLYNTLVTSQHALNLGVTPPFMHIGGGGTGASNREQLLAEPWNADASPWAGLLAAPFALSWWLLADPAVLQWVLPLRSVASRRGAVAIASILSLVTFYVAGTTGVVARLRLGKTMSCSPTGRPCTNEQMAVGAMVTLLMPTGLRGLLVATLLACIAWRWASHLRACAALVVRALCVPACPKRVPAFQTLGGQAAAAADVETASPDTVRVQRMLWASAVLGVGGLSLAWIGQLSEGGVLRPAARAVVETPLTFGAPLGALVMAGVLFPWMKWHGAAFGLSLAHLGAFLRLVTSSAAHVAAAAVAAGDQTAAASIKTGQWTLGGTSVLLYTLVEIAVCLVAAAALSLCGAPAFPELAIQEQGGSSAATSSTSAQRLLSLQGLRCAARCSSAPAAQALLAAADSVMAADVREEEQRALLFLSTQGRGDVGVLPTTRLSHSAKAGGAGSSRSAAGGGAYAVVGTGEVDSLVQAEEDVVLDLDSDPESDGSGGAAFAKEEAPPGASPVGPKGGEGAFEDDEDEMSDFAAEVTQGVPDGAMDAVLRDDEQESKLWWYVNVSVQVAAALTVVAFW